VAGVWADLVLMVHALYVGFVVVGWMLIVAGGVRRWSGVRNPWFRLLHGLAIGFVVAEAWWGADCPLTVWENQLRLAAGEIAYSESFIQHWVSRIIFYDFPPFVFIAAYTLFGGLVLLTWIWVPPRFRTRPKVF
jgi:hypothetical protein